MLESLWFVGLGVKGFRADLSTASSSTKAKP